MIIGDPITATRAEVARILKWHKMLRDKQRSENKIYHDKKFDYKSFIPGGPLVASLARR